MIAPRGSYYAVLGIEDTADEESIRGNFRLLMRRFHPDVNRSPNATRRSAEITEAFRVLVDPDSRAAYDRQLREARPNALAARRGALVATIRPNPLANGKAAAIQRPRHSPLSQRIAFTVALAALASGAAIVGFKIQNRIMSQSHATRVVSDGLRPDPTLAILNTFDEREVLPSPRGDLDRADAVADRFVVAPPPVLPAIVSQAVGTFAALRHSGGIAAAKSYSERCHRLAERDISLESSDFCAALDHAAFIDPVVPETREYATSITYFIEMHDREQVFYDHFDLSADVIQSRLDQLRAMVTPAQPPSEQVTPAAGQRVEPPAVSSAQARHALRTTARSTWSSQQTTANTLDF